MWVKKLIGKCKSNKKQFILLASLFLFTVYAIGIKVSAADAQDKVPYTIELNSQTNNLSSSLTSLADAEPADEMKDGAVLHAWCWSFDTIKSNMAAIAEAGYTSIQTSPVTTCVVGNGGDLKFTNQWWYHYQPTDYTIGNYQIGTEADFAEMCEEADKYGIRIIVDVIANHCTSDYSKISDNIKNISGFFHTNTQISDWSSRQQITQLSLLGLWDNNTQNTNVQNYIKSFLNRCVELGADGFRYDAAKHIELPDDGSYGGNFWPTILNNGSDFQYGEILQDSVSRESAYANYMSVTASSYGKKLRDNIGSSNLSAGTITSYEIGVDSDKLVTWVESHDNYANAITDYGSSQWMTDEQIKLLWAVVGARQGGTPLFFSRPVGGGGQSWDNRFPELTKIGDRGSSLFMDDEVAAVNKFRNAMGDNESEYLRNPSGNTSVLMIERGEKGVVIVNALSSAYSLNSVTNLADGTYENQTDDNSVYTVESGVITGILPARSVVVLAGQAVENQPEVSIENAVTSFKTDTYTLTLKAKNTVNATYQINDEPSYLYEDSDTITIGDGHAYGTEYQIELRGINEDGVTVSNTYTITKKDPAQGISIYFEKPSSWGTSINAYIYDESGTTVKKIASWPGVAMENLGNGLYYYLMEEEYDNPLVIFNDGTNQSPGANQKGFAVTDGTTYTINGPVEEPETENSITIYYYTGWSTANIHYQIGSGSWTTAPGIAMETSSITGYKQAAIDLGEEETLAACFNNGSGTWDNNSGKNYTFTAPGVYTVKNGVIYEGTPSTNNIITIYYYTSWENAHIHYQIASGSWTTSPGAAMSTSSVSGYKISTIDLGTELSLTACFNNGSGSWDNNNGNNYKFSAPGTFTVKNGVITAGVPG